MTGRRTTAAKRRQDLLLAELYAADHPLTTKELTQAAGESYSAVYQTLRRMCGSHTMPYSQQGGAVNAPGFPVIWHSWDDPDRETYVAWSLTTEERGRQAAVIAQLEAVFAP